MTTEICAQCGEENHPTYTYCKNCHAPLTRKESNPANPQPVGIVLEDGYVLPPPPQVGIPGTGIWRDKSKLVMDKNAALPHRCVKCNQPAHGPLLKRKLTWHHPALYLLVLVAILIYALVAMLVRQTASIEIGLCETHRARRRRAIIITWSLVVLGIFSFVIAIMGEDLMYALVGLLLLFGGTIYGIVAIRTVAAAKIDSRFVWLQGINADYLNELPQWPGV